MSRKGKIIFKRKDDNWEVGYIKEYERHQFGGFCEQWLQMQKSKIKESTYVKYNTIVERHIKPKLGNCFLTDVTPQVVETFKLDLLKNGLAPKTVKDILMVLHSILNYTAKMLPGIFPMVEIQYPKETRKEMRVLTLEEQQRFVSYLQEDMDECKLGVLLALLTGLRIGELCALQWGNISVRNRTIYVCATMQRIKNLTGDEGGKTKVLMGSPKSDTSIRTIPISDNAAELCKKMRSKNPANFLLTGTQKYMEPRTLQYRLDKYTRECGLDGVHFHTLRHTFATRCVELGFDVKSLSEILGHANVNITMNRYVHPSMELKQRNMNILDGLLTSYNPI